MSEITGIRNGQKVDRSKWRASNLFREYGWAGASARHAWKSEFTINEFDKGAYLCVAINGKRGREAAWAAMKIDGRYVGCPDRAPSFTCNPWEYRNADTDQNYTYYIPLTPDMKGKKLEVYALSFEGRRSQARGVDNELPHTVQAKNTRVQEITITERKFFTRRETDSSFFNKSFFMIVIMSLPAREG